MPLSRIRGVFWLFVRVVGWDEGIVVLIEVGLDDVEEVFELVVEGTVR